MGFVGGAEVADQKVGEDGSGGVEGGGVGLVLRVPIVFAFNELFWRVFGSEGEVAFRVIGFAICGPRK